MKVINALMDDWGNRYEGRATQAHEDPNAEARRFAASEEFARKTMERMLRQGEEEERERHENQTTQGASASKGTRSTNDVESGRRAAAASRDVEGCPDCPHMKEAKMSFDGHLKKRGKRKINQYIFSYCCEAQRISCAARRVAEYALKPASCLSCHGWPEMGKASRTSRFATVACAALGSQASASNSAERPPTQTRQHKNTHKNTQDTNTNKKRKHTQTQKHTN